MEDQQKTSIANYFIEAQNIIVYKNNNKHLFFKGDDKFEIILSALQTICESCHDMPAFDVSLDNETVEAKKQGDWIELIFGSTEYFNEMPFDSLLIKVNPNDKGFNIIRKHNNKYDGRCFYLNLQNDMKKLAKVINNI